MGWVQLGRPPDWVHVVAASWRLGGGGVTEDGIPYGSCGAGVLFLCPVASLEGHLRLECVVAAL